jgi:hypothetical protein
MKILLFFFLLISTVCFSQRNNITVQLSKGTRSLYSKADQIFSDWDNLSNLSRALDLSSTTPSNPSEYSSYTSLKDDKAKFDVITFAIGVSNKTNTLCYNLMLSNEKNYFSDNGIKTANVNLFTVAAEVILLYKKLNDKCKLYGSTGVGVTFIKRDYVKGISNRNNAVFAFSISPICFSYGNKYGFTVEPSLGYKSFLNIGAFYKF